MKKLILFSILAISLFAFVSEALAVSYYGNATPSYTSISSSSGEIFSLYNNVFHNNAFYSSGVSDTDIYHYGFLQASIEPSFSGEITDFGGGLVDNVHNDGFRYVFTRSGSLIYGNLYSITIVGNYVYTLVSSQLLVADFPSSCPGASSDCVIQFLITYHTYDDTFYPGNYMKSIRTIVYDGSSVARHYEYNFDSNAQDVGGTWFTDWRTFLFGNTPAFLGYRLSTSPYFGTYQATAFPKHRNIVFSAGTGSFDDYVSAHIGFSTYSFPSSLGTSVGTKGIDPNSGSGEIDYFADCSSFLDVGCYVQGSFNGIVDKVKGFFTGIWSWLIPDFDINWNGTTSTCATYQGSTGSTSSGVTVSSSSGSLGVLQKLANIFATVSPFPPPQGSTVCLLDGVTKTINYKSTTVNFFDIIIILLCILPIVFASHEPSKQ